MLLQISAVASLSNSHSDVLNTVKEIAPLGIVISSTAHTSMYGAKLNMALYHYDEWQRMNNAKKIAHLSDLNYQLVKQELVIRVAQVYFSVLSAKDNYAISLKTWWRISEGKTITTPIEPGDDNPNIPDYMGYFKLTTVYSTDQFDFYFKGRSNFIKHHSAIELGLTFPLI